MSLNKKNKALKLLITIHFIALGLFTIVLVCWFSEFNIGLHQNIRLFVFCTVLLSGATICWIGVISKLKASHYFKTYLIIPILAFVLIMIPSFGGILLFYAISKPFLSYGVVSKKEKLELREAANFLGPGYRYAIIETKYRFLENHKGDIHLDGQIIPNSVNIKEDDSLIRVEFSYDHIHDISLIKDTVLTFTK